MTLAYSTCMTSEENGEPQKKWEGLLRGSILSSCIAKHVQYIGFADRRAQGIITVNSFIVPIAFTGMAYPQFQLASIIAVITAILTIAMAIFSLYPKQYSHEDHGHRNLLHFSDIKNLSENEYLHLMRESLADTGKLAEMAVTDIHHLAAHILKRKMYWLKVSYSIFLVGFTITVIAALMQ